MTGLCLLEGQPGALLAAPPEAPRGAVVKLVRASWECFSDTLYVTGLLVPRQEAVVFLDERTKVTEVMAGAGDQVKSGQVLARAVGLVGETAPPAPAKAANNTIAIKAPAAGTVMQTTASIGAGPAPTGQPLFRIIAGSEIELEADVPGPQVPKLESGQTARIKLKNGTELIGRLRRPPAQIDRATQLGRARLSVPQDPSLRTGMFAEATITIDASHSCGVAVPRDAVLRSSEGTSVQLVRNGIVETKRVQLGLSSVDTYEIKSGIEKSDIIVAHAGSSLHDGDVVQVNLSDDLND
jgi:multidrug efflux pump subunit AcrA (membrane-fusion protein)